MWMIWYNGRTKDTELIGYAYKKIFHLFIMENSGRLVNVICIFYINIKMEEKIKFL